MHNRLFVAPLLLIMLLSSQIVLLPSQVSAVLPWCGCGNCWMANLIPPPCSCSYPYRSCLDDLDPLQFHTLTDYPPADTNSIPQDLTSTIARADVTERVMDLMSGGDCFRSKVALSLLGNARDALKFTPVRFDERNLLAFQMEVDKEK